MKTAAWIIAALIALTCLVGTAEALPNAYPSITDAEADRDGDFDSGCQLFGGDGGWQTDNIGSDRNGEGVIDRTRVAEGLCSAHLSGTGEHRAELAWSGIANPQVLVEQAFYVPSNSGYLGFVNQWKQTSSASGCANGGISNRSGSNLEVTVRASCSADNVRFDIGTYPRDQWWALRYTFRMGNAGMVAASVDVDAAGPATYVRRLQPTTVDNQTGDSSVVKFRAGSYGDQNVDLWLDAYRLTFIP